VFFCSVVNRAIRVCSYAGGKGQPPGDGKVCYHNARQDHDYGSFGHAEVINHLGAYYRDY